MEQHIILVTPQADSMTPIAEVIKTVMQHSISTVSPFQAVAAAEGSVVDLAIFDIQTGKELLPLVRDFKQRFPLVPLVAVVPYADVGMVEKVLEYGVDDYISQPIALERLKTTLRNALRMRNMMVRQDGEKSSMLNYVGASLPQHVTLQDHSGNLQSLKAIEDAVIDYAIQTCDCCITQAARSLGIGRSTLYRKMQEKVRSGKVSENVTSNGVDQTSRENQTTLPITAVSSGVDSKVE